MQAVILAAGMATRLKPLTDETPKCLLILNDKPILHKMIENLKEINISDIIIVTGFEKEKIEEYLSNHFKDLKITYVFNKDYETTNNAYSLLLAESQIKSEFVLLDSDIVFHPNLVKMLLDFPHRPVLAVDRHACGEEEMKVVVGKNLQISDISKDIDVGKAWGESVGIEIFSEQSAEILFKTLKKRVIQEKNINEFYEASFDEMIKEGNPFYGLDTSKYPAMEIDFSEDLQAARRLQKEIDS